MMTISKPLSAGQAKDYYQAEYTNTQESYYTEDESVKGKWFGKQAADWGLEGEVDEESFERLCEGQDPRTGLQLVRHVTAKEYENAYGEMVETSEHRAGWDATFSAPKSVSLAALVGGDERIIESHKKSVDGALSELEKYVQARIGGNNPAETTGKMIAAKFEHDAARPDRATGYAAPQLHTHVVIFNLTQTEDGRIKPIQPIELYRSQQYATAIYRTVLATELQKLGYEVTVDARTGAPEIHGFSKEYLAASSPRRQEIEQEAAEMKERMAQQGISVEDGAGLRQAAAKTDRMSKRYDRNEMRARHLRMDARFGEQAVRVAEAAQERGSLSLGDDEIKSRAQAAVTFARENAGEREAVVDKRRVMVDALRRNLAFTTYDAVVKELNERVESGEFIRLMRNGKMEELTTSQTVAMERSNLEKVAAGRGTQEPILGGEGSGPIIEEVAGQGIVLSESQRAAIGTILESHDRIVGLQGLAGTGKTTALAVLREAVEGKGYQVEGFAPTGAAADLLAESGIKTSTLQKFVATTQMESDTGKKILYIMDESSLSDTRNMFLFFKKAGPVARLLLVGDTGQHQAVEAGAPFEQFVKAGMQTATLDEIVRQKSDLKIPVEQLSKREVLLAVQTLSEQGRITKIADDEDRLNAIAKDYLSNPKGTLVISPANQERVAINSIIHRQLQEQGIVSGDDHEVNVLVNRQDMTGTERKFALAYVPGEDIVRYNTASKVYAVNAGDYGRVLNANHRDNEITVRLESGREIVYNPERLSGVSVYKEAKRSFAEGDRIQFRAPFAEAKIRNSELGTITEITDEKLTVALAGKRIVTFNPERFRHLDHGYAVTSYSAQGKTMDRVLVNAETTETDMLLNQRMAYVAMSRARFDARVYTDSVADLGGALNRPKDKEMALDALKESQSVASNERSKGPPITAMAQSTDAPEFGKLEGATQIGTNERDQVDHNSFSVARLRGQAILAESNVAAAEKRSEDYEKSKHFVKFEIDGEQRSLVSVDQQQRGKERAIELNKRTVSAYRKRLYGVIHNPIKLYGILDYKEKAAKAKGRIRQAREEIKQLQPIRKSVTEFIQRRRGVLQDNVAQETQFSRTLNSALAVEVDLHLNQGQGIPQPEFNVEELDQLEENATKLRDSKMLMAAENYVEQHYGDTREGIVKITARAASVEESAKASLRGASERIRSFVEKREFFPVVFRGVDGSDKTASLNDLAPKTLGEKVSSYFSISQRLEIAAVQQALDDHQTHLLQERDMLQQFTQAAGEITESYREKLQAMNLVMPPPQFTTQEVAGIGSFDAQQTVASLGTQFQEATISATSGGGIAGISNPAQQAAQRIDLGMAHQQSTADNHLEQARQRLDKVSAESVAANETGMGAGLAADTEAAGSEALAAVL